MRVNNYRVYGVNISSQIEINELIKVNNLTNKNIDVKYFYGIVPDKIRELHKIGVNTYYSKNEIWFHIKDVASYYITNGNSVLVEPCNHANRQLINLFLTGSCLGFIMIQKERIAIHGGTIIINNKAIILTGDRGAGKSTLSTALRLKGYKFMSDDISAIYIDDIPMIYYGFPYQKLCEDAINNFGYENENYNSFKVGREIKYSVPALNEFVCDNMPLSAIIEISVEDVDVIKFEEIKGNKKLVNIIKNIYRSEYFDYVGGVSPKIFKQCLDIAKKIKCYKIIRPKYKFTINDQIKILEDLLI